MKQVLFLCTGNFYRSRFAEEYINHHAQQEDLSLRAISRGLHTPEEMRSNGNVGCINPDIVDLLASLSIETASRHRMPLSVGEHDFHESALVYALDAAEHQTMMRERFPGWADRIDYLDVPDLQFERFATAMPKLVARLDALLQGWL